MGNVSFGDAAGLGRWRRHHISRRAAKVINHRLHNNYGLAADVIDVVERHHGDRGLFYLAFCLGVVGIPPEVHRRRGHAIVPDLAYQTADGTFVENADVDTAPPRVRAHVRMLMSFVHGDSETAICVWETMPREDKRAMVRAFADMAVHGFARHPGRLS